MSTLIHSIHNNASQYRKLTHELSRETESRNEMKAICDEQTLLKQRIQAKQADLRTLEAQSKKEFDEVRKARHLSLRSAAAALKGKKKELIAKEEARYQQAFENEQRCRSEYEELCGALSRVETRAEGAQRQLDQIDRDRNLLNRMFDQVFSTNDPAYPLETQLKAEVQNYIEQRRLAQRDCGRFRDADHNLGQALRETVRVSALLDACLTYIPFDIFGGTTVDVQQVIYVEAARKHVYEAQRRINIACSVLPEIPNPALLDVVSNNRFLSMQFNSTFIDTTWQAATHEMLYRITLVQRNIENSMTWTRQYMQYAEGAVSKLNQAIENAQRALEKERRRIFERVLAGRPPADAAGASSSTSHDDDSLMYSPTYDAPPPVYEAPPASQLPPNGNSETLMPSLPTNASFPLNNTPPMENISIAPPIQLSPSQAPTQPPRPITPVTSGQPLSSYPPPQYVSQNAHNPFQQTHA
ncbi:hypothetical protein CLU79DRAFT_761554 [Phycomyces nitens]|nr:hypothetical protein CLU79DRAFT_761554 [Phycomyces nitens]